MADGTRQLQFPHRQTENGIVGTFLTSGPSMNALNLGKGVVILGSFAVMIGD